MKFPRVILFLLLVTGCATYRVPSGDRYALYMDGVTSEMSTPEFWLSRSAHPDRIIMTEPEIAETFPTPEKEFDIFSSEGKTDTAFLDRWAKIFSKRRMLFDSSGYSIDSCHWDQAIDNMDVGNYRCEVRYAVTVTNTEERVLPTTERGYQDSDNAFFDDLVMTMLLANEQVLVLHKSLDGKWLLVLGRYAPAGWVRMEDIAFCESRESWLETQSGDFLLITADRFRLDMENPDRKDYIELTMGTKLRLIDPNTLKPSDGNRFPKNVYAVAMPKRESDGMLGYRVLFLPAREGVHVGYLPYTSRNILELAFSCLGDRYGWGGTFGARDCSSFCQDIYRCFGILLPRNSRMQASFIGKTWILDGMNSEEKLRLLKKEAIPGAPLFMPGHVFIYLGEKDGSIYTINSASSFMIGGEKRYIQSVVINSLDEIRSNGKTWLESTTNLKIYEKEN